MKQIIAIILGLAICTGVQADIWKWVDIHGESHFVDSTTPIFTWVDEFDKVHYSDKPGHEDAVSVQLVWHSTDKSAESDQAGGGKANKHLGESVEEAHERKVAEAYYCKRATEYLSTLTNAPKLYRTGDDGKRIFLSDEDSEKAIGEAEADKNEWCQ